MRNHLPHGLYVATITFILGLLQLLLLMFWDALSQEFSMNWQEIVKTCGILFFASAVLGSCALSYHLHTKPINNRKAAHFLFFVTPLLVLVLTIVSYIVAIVDQTVREGVLLIAQMVILAITFIYLSIFTAYERSVAK